MAIHKMLMHVHNAGKQLSSASKGAERESFINYFLKELFPTQFRFSHGDIIDSEENKSGQVDIVIEYPFLPSFPIPGASSRLYLSEGVAAVIEVKSDLRNQWDEVLASAKKIKALKRDFGATLTSIPNISEDIPYFVVGYRGWKTMDSLKNKADTDLIDGIFCIDTELYHSPEKGIYPYVDAGGSMALLMFIERLTMEMTSLKSTTANLVPYILKGNSGEIIT